MFVTDFISTLVFDIKLIYEANLILHAHFIKII